MFFVGLAGIDGKVDYCGIAKGCSCPGCGGQSPSTSANNTIASTCSSCR